MGKRKALNRIFCFYILLILVIILGCGKWKEQPKDETVPLTFNYDSLVSCAKAFVPAIGAHGGTLTLPAYADPVSFNPVTTPGVVPYMYEGLVRIDPATDEPQPWLAEDWHVSEDNLTWKFFIRKKVSWSDSVPFTAYDVAFTFNELIYNDHIIPNPSRSLFIIEGEKIAISVLDSFTVQFVLPKVYAPFLRFMSQVILPHHAYKAFVANGVFADSLTIKTPPATMTGTGPFMLASYTPFSSLIFTRNPLYWQMDSAQNYLPYLDSIVYILMSDLDDALESFTSGDIDYLAADGNDYTALSEKDTTYSIYHLGPALGSNAIIFNQNRGRKTSSGNMRQDSIKTSWFQKKKFRKAIAHAVNRQRIIDTHLKGRGYPQWSPLSAGAGCFYNPAVKKYPYDLKKADTLLLQLGYKDRNNDGFLEDTDSNTIAFTFLVSNSNILRKNIAEALCMDLERLGLKVDLQMQDAKLITKRLYHPPYEWDMVILGFLGGSEPHLGWDIWHTSGASHLWYPNQEEPLTKWEARINYLFETGIALLDREARKAVYDEWQYIASDELPCIFTVQSERIICVSKRIGNVNPTVHGGVLHTVEELFVNKNGN